MIFPKNGVSRCAGYLRDFPIRTISLRQSSQAQAQKQAQPVEENSLKNGQFLQQSTVPTMHFQRSLPRLPIPKLEKTVERYLKAQEPLQTKEEHTKTAGLARKFLEKDGKGLSLKSSIDCLIVP